MKIGDKVICLDDEMSNGVLVAGQIYTVQTIGIAGGLQLKEDQTGISWVSERFKISQGAAAAMESSLASRKNAGKIRPSLFPVVVYRECLKVLQFGADKYGDFNWQKGFKYLDCADSLERHWLDWKSGQDHDEESKLYHLAHVMVNAMFLLFYQVTGGYEHLDNRKITNKQTAQPAKETK